MYALLSFTIGALVSGIFCFWCNRKESKLLHPKDRPLIADTHISIAQPGDILVMIGTEAFYAHKSNLISLKTLCHRLKEKDVEIVFVSESVVKQTWIIPRDTLLSKQSDHSINSSDDCCNSGNMD